MFDFEVQQRDNFNGQVIPAGPGARKRTFDRNGLLTGPLYWYDSYKSCESVRFSYESQSEFVRIRTFVLMKIMFFNIFQHVLFSIVSVELYRYDYCSPLLVQVQYDSYIVQCTLYNCTVRIVT